MSEKVPRPAVCLGGCGRTLTRSVVILDLYCSMPCAGLVDEGRNRRRCVDNGFGWPKLPFINESQASRAADLNSEPYHCEVCGFWHVGHKRKGRNGQAGEELSRGAGEGS